jgi:hypothetical protein
MPRPVPSRGPVCRHSGSVSVIELKRAVFSTPPTRKMPFDVTGSQAVFIYRDKRPRPEESGSACVLGTQELVDGLPLVQTSPEACGAHLSHPLPRCRPDVRSSCRASPRKCNPRAGPRCANEFFRHLMDVLARAVPRGQTRLCAARTSVGHTTRDELRKPLAPPCPATDWF